MLSSSRLSNGKILLWAVILQALTLGVAVWLIGSQTQALAEANQMNRYLIGRILHAEKVSTADEFEAVKLVYSAWHAAFEKLLTEERAKVAKKKIEQHIERVNPRAPAKVVAKYIVDCAKRAKLDPTLWAAVVHQESHFDPYAEGPFGERGLAQLTRSTAESLGVTWEDAYDIKKNLCAGARYLSEHMVTYHGSIRRALVRYNGGEDYPKLVLIRHQQLAR